MSYYIAVKPRRHFRFGYTVYDAYLFAASGQGITVKESTCPAMAVQLAARNLYPPYALRRDVVVRYWT